MHCVHQYIGWLKFSDFTHHWALVPPTHWWSHLFFLLMLVESLHCKRMGFGAFPITKRNRQLSCPLVSKRYFFKQIYSITRKRLSKLNLCYFEKIMDQIVVIFLLPITVVIVCSGRCKETMWREGLASYWGDYECFWTIKPIPGCDHSLWNWEQGQGI